MQFSTASFFAVAVFATSIAAAPASESTTPLPTNVPTPPDNFCLPQVECVTEESDDCPWGMVPAQEEGCWTCCFEELPPVFPPA